MTVGIKMLVPTANTATAFQEITAMKWEPIKYFTDRWTLSGYLDHTEAAITDEQWAWIFKVPGTAAAGLPSLSALMGMYRQTAVTGGSANLLQLTWVDPTLNVAVTSTAYFQKIGREQLDPYNFLVECLFRKYQGP